MATIKIAPKSIIKYKIAPKVKTASDVIKTHLSPTTEPLLITTTKHLIAYSAATKATKNFQKLVLKIAKVAKQEKEMSIALVWRAL